MTACVYKSALKQYFVTINHGLRIPEDSSEDFLPPNDIQSYWTPVRHKFECDDQINPADFPMKKMPYCWKLAFLSMYTKWCLYEVLILFMLPVCVENKGWNGFRNRWPLNDNDQWGKYMQITNYLYSCIFAMITVMFWQDHCIVDKLFNFGLTLNYNGVLCTSLNNLWMEPSKPNIWND